MTIDEAISHAMEVAEQNETKALRIGRQYEGTLLDREAKECRRCATDHRQLAEWLKELKALKEIYNAETILSEFLHDINKILCNRVKELEEKVSNREKEYKRLLKMAVEDISKMPCNNDTHTPDSCYICVKHGNCSYTDSFKWCKADIALKLIGDEPNK